MIKFGTGGWRAIIGEEFTKENIQKLALAMSLKIKAEHVEDKPVVIGYDRRFLSKEASESDIEITRKCTSEIVRLFGLKNWLCDICTQTLITMLQTSHNSLVPVILEGCVPLYEETSRNEEEELVTPVALSPSSLLLLLQIQLLLRERSLEIANPSLAHIFVNNASVNAGRLATLMSVYAASSYVFPKLHPLWSTSITYIQTFSESPDVALIDWWNAVTDEVMPSSMDRKG